MRAKTPAVAGMVVWRWSTQRLAIGGIYFQNNPFLDMFQLKFCLKHSKLVHYRTPPPKTFEILKCNILAIILFKYW